MDIIKAAIDLMSSKKEEPKPKKPLTASDLKNFASKPVTFSADATRVAKPVVIQGKPKSNAQIVSYDSGSEKQKVKKYFDPLVGGRNILVKLSGNNKIPYSVDDLNNVSAKWKNMQTNAYKSWIDTPDLVWNDTKNNLRNKQTVPSGKVEAIVRAAVRNNLDPYLALSIAQRETGIGSYSLPANVEDKSMGKIDQPYITFQNWSKVPGLKLPDVLTAEEQDEIHKGFDTRQVPAKLFQKLEKYYNRGNDYPFQSEILDIIDKTKGGKNVRGWNPGDPNYANKIALERSIIMDPSNKKIQDFVNSVIADEKSKGKKK
jgi:hypothetical protein